MTDDTVSKKSKKRKFKISGSFGTKHAWRWIKKNKWLNIGYPITEKQFGIIVKTINKHLINKFLQGSDIIFPHNLGRLELIKYKSKVYFEGDKIKTNRPIDWKQTRELWDKDEKCRKEKILIRFDSPYLYRINYKKPSKGFKNQSFIQFTPCRDLKLKLKDKIINNQIDAFLNDKF